MMRSRHWVAMVTLLCAATAGAQSNPYCVSGANWSSNGVMIKLGMPGAANDANGSIAYVWDTLQPTNVTNMVRPKRYWEYVGANPNRIQGYNHITDTILDPVAFGQWVIDHPGQVWIIGNEPDLTGQDGLTPAEYARMFHRYYEFIHVEGRDLTARFATAGLAGMADPGWLVDDKAWWNQALASYASQFGSEMPIDVWNCHGYVSAGAMDPDRAINEYFLPFQQYTRTVRGGIYADTELWVTEFGAGGVGPELAAEYMAQICPRLEAMGVNRFFWFLGPWEDPWGDTSLLTRSGTPTILGTTFCDLATSFPNPIPPPSPSQQEPFPAAPATVNSEFDGNPGLWKVMVGDWTLDAGAYRQSRRSGACFMSSYLPLDYRDVQVDVDLKILAFDDAQSWVGVTLRGGFIWHDNDTRTYLVYLRQNGELGLWTQADGTVASAPGAVVDMSAYHRLQIRLVGPTLDVSVDGQRTLSWTDPNGRRASGLVALRTCKTDASFDNVTVHSIVASDFDKDLDVDLADFSFFEACYNGPNRAPTFAQCTPADLDADSDVDLADFAVFLGDRPSNRS